MCNPPNEGKSTAFFQKNNTSAEIKVDLRSLYVPSDILIEHAEYDESCRSYRLFSRCGLDYGVCPYCGCKSHKVHSNYIRTVTDLSILGCPVVITLKVRKFFCRNPSCLKKTFAEQPGDEVFRYRRRTRRCDMAVIQHGLETSSESAGKLLSAMGIRVSGDTVLRDMHRMPIPPHHEAKAIGVDDWAFRKGVTYGSIIVSLDTGDVIDLLGSRDADGFRKWLDSHPRVAVVSRDRSTDYTAAIAATGRNITEVADRFHLNKNMSDCMKKVIGSHYDDYRKSVRTATAQKASGKDDSRQVMFNEVKELQGSGLNIAQIAKKLGVARQTVRKYMKLDSIPERASKERLPYYLYDTYVEDEYRHGKDLRKIFFEVRDKGFMGSLTPFYEHYEYLSDGHHGYRSRQDVEKMKRTPRVEREPLLPIRQIAHIVDKSIRGKEMLLAEQTLIERLSAFSWFTDIYKATSSFYETVMGDSVEKLTHWLETFSHSPVNELRSFANGIRMDLKAVKNAISMDVSNGIVEGYVNKLKAVKRSMYGRASLELLKRKMVFGNLCFN